MTSEELAFFDNIASRWDSMEVKSVPSKVAELLDIVGIEAGMDVLDLGTGTGVLLSELASRVGEEGTVLGVDFSEGMLSEAYKKISGLPNVGLKRLDFEKDPVEGRFDLIMLYCVYPHLSTPREDLLRLSRENLKPGGRIVIGFPTDEKYINSIHHEREEDDGLHSDGLPPAPDLASRISCFGLRADVLAYGPERYLVEVKNVER